MVIVFDLDDTLYDEIEFVKSGFKEIADFLGGKKYFDFMWSEFQANGSGKIFDQLIKEFGLDVSLNKLIEIYRFHYPDIKLPKESKELLDFAKRYKNALITDGHYITQKNKYKALNLELDYPIFTDFYQTKKTELKPFLMVMDKFKDEKYIYIADNPKKDFLAAKQLSWVTIRYKNPKGIYKDITNNAEYEVSSRSEILKKLKEIYDFSLPS